ncbi:hypothetical protein ACIQLG_03905 [Terribacillus saccharophilus]|uniref:hypothetical protein n=1 Tax=Terribacillus saccharophilus TaxID=361277 RepID=UPI003818CCF4
MKDPFEEIKKISSEMNRLVRESMSPMVQFDTRINEIRNILSEPTRVFRRLALNLPDYIKDPEKRDSLTKDIINYVSSKGWTFSEIIPFRVLIDPELLKLNADDLDSFFLELYAEGVYEGVKEHTIDKISIKHKPLLEEVFFNIDHEKYKIAIPSLILIIEGEISEITENNAMGWNLVNDWRLRLEQNDMREVDEFLYAKTLALTNFLSEHLFTSNKFWYERKPFVNRNWVMHGRDDSELWTVTEVYKLINFLETIVEIKQKLRLRSIIISS